VKIEPQNTQDGTVDFRKTLLYAHHGWGKTTQAKYYQAYYGPGYILSGESGLSSIRGAGIDYNSFFSWDDKDQHASGRYSFKGLIEDVVNTKEFRLKYKWIMVDSLTELGDLSMAHEEKNAKPTKNGEINGFELWENHASNLLGACKYVRDLPMHVIVTSLAKQDTDENGNVNHWPMIKGKQIQKQLPGIFDCVLCGVRTMSTDANDPGVIRMIVTDEYRGWHGKVRDENRVLSPVEFEHDVTKLFRKMERPEDMKKTTTATAPLLSTV
jgi:hypothetical protein